MLSGETATGDYPLQAVRMMDRIAREAERHAEHSHCRKVDPSTTSDIVAHSACHAADNLKAKAIICFTRSGATALMISGFRPKTPIIAATPDEAAFRKLRLYYGIMPIMVRLKRDTDSMVREVEKSAVKRKLVKTGDRVVVTLGVPVLVESKTNLMVIHAVGEEFRH
jgi:pyruvate kinase